MLKVIHHKFNTHVANMNTKPPTTKTTILSLRAKTR